MIPEISYDNAVAFPLPRHYAGRKPMVSRPFGLVENGSAL